MSSWAMGGRMNDQGGYYIEELSVGQAASVSRTVTDADILMFAGVSGDTNPVHLDQDYASQTMFGGRIAHGMLTAGLISAVLGTKLPGPGTVYLSQTLKFKAPVKPGDTVKATCTISEIVADRKRVKMTTVAQVGDVIVMEGEAGLMVPSRG